MSKYDENLETNNEEMESKEYSERETTPCGCTMFACWECSSYPICSQY